MKKRILAVLLSIGCLLSLGGCSDNPNETNRFISTNETIIISGEHTKLFMIIILK